MGCSVTLVGSNFDIFQSSQFAATIELDGTVLNEQYESFPFAFGDGRELFDTSLKYYKLIENTWRNKIFEANIFVIHEVLLKFTKILSQKCLEPYGINSWQH